MSKGKLFVISGASGVGKGTVLGIMMKKRGDLSFSVSATTRPPRPSWSKISRDAMSSTESRCGSAGTSSSISSLLAFSDGIVMVSGASAAAVPSGVCVVWAEPFGLPQAARLSTILVASSRASNFFIINFSL